MPSFRLNLDAGELADEDPALRAEAHWLNIACGAHAGGVAIARAVLAEARVKGQTVGAHPGYPDRANFGRRVLTMPTAALCASLAEQLTWLAALARDEGVGLAHVKLHGALYHAANGDPALAEALVDTALATLGALAWVGPPTGALRELSARRGLQYYREGFSDRGYTADGQLIARGQPGALVGSVDDAVAQSLRLVASGQVDTVCLHADSPLAPQIARALRALERA